MAIIIVRVAENKKFVSRYFYIFQKYLLNIYYILNTVLGIQETALSTAD